MENNKVDNIKITAKNHTRISQSTVNNNIFNVYTNLDIFNICNYTFSDYYILRHVFNIYHTAV